MIYGFLKNLKYIGNYLKTGQEIYKCRKYKSRRI